MQRKALLIIPTVAMVVAGAALAWPFTYSLLAQQTSVSKSGTQSLSLAYDHPLLSDAKQLIDDINTQAGSPVVIQVAKYVPLNDLFAAYTGTTGIAFPLTPPEGYMVQVNQSANYAITGNNVSSYLVSVYGQGPNSASGWTLISVPDTAPTTLVDAKGLLNQIGPTALWACRFVKTVDLWACYSGATGVAFPLIPGEAYKVQVSADTTFPMPP
jgi:hypothetical protein